MDRTAKTAFLLLTMSTWNLRVGRNRASLLVTPWRFVSNESQIVHIFRFFQSMLLLSSFCMVIHQLISWCEGEDLKSETFWFPIVWPIVSNVLLVQNDMDPFLITHAVILTRIRCPDSWWGLSIDHSAWKILRYALYRARQKRCLHS